MNQKKKQSPANPSGFKAELKIKPLPVQAEEYAMQYFINLVLQGFIFISPNGYCISKDNIKEAMETWTR